MKNKILVMLLGVFFGTNTFAQSNEQASLGDQLSLEGVLSIFEKSESIEDFELRLNEDNYSNNLDLNDDGDVDYLRVEDRNDGDVHAIVIQAILDKDEAQDVAVIEIEKNGAESALLQIVGDEDLFGEMRIVEPYEVDANSDSRGPDGGYATFKVVVNVFFWTPVRHIYRPNYRPWISPYRWRVYPKVYRPWKVRSWTLVHRHRKNHNHRFHVVRTHRVAKAHRIYTPHKRKSVRVVNKTKVVKTNRKGNKKVVKTKSKTVTKSKNGKKVKKTSRVKVKRKK